MAGDFSHPAIDDLYADIMTHVRALFADLAKGLDATGTSNIPAGAIRWNSTNKRWEKYYGTSWAALETKYSMNVDQLDGYHAANTSGAIPISNGTVNANLNADMLDGLHVGSFLRYDADNNAALGAIRTAGAIEAGKGSGSVGLTANDGYGNANLTFNHFVGVPDVSGSSCRIVTTVDSTSAFMAFQLGNSTTSGVAVALTETLALTTSTITFLGNKVWHAGNDGAGSGLDADTLDAYHAGNASGNIPISNGTACTNLNADMLDGYHASSFTQATAAATTVASNLSVVAGDVLYGSAANTLSRLAKGSDGQFLSLASGIPTWATVATSPPDMISLTTRAAPTISQNIPPDSWINIKFTVEGAHTLYIYPGTSDAGTFNYINYNYVAHNGTSWTFGNTANAALSFVAPSGGKIVGEMTFYPVIYESYYVGVGHYSIITSSGCTYYQIRCLKLGYTATVRCAYSGSDGSKVLVLPSYHYFYAGY